MGSVKKSGPKRTASHRHAPRGKSADTAKNLARLKRIEGQVRGIANMVNEGRYCAEILVQISAAQEALRGVGKELMRHHLRHCATEAMRGSHAEAEAMHEEILRLMYAKNR